MKSLTVCLLADQSIWVGEIPHQEDLRHRFHTESSSRLERFTLQNKDEITHLCRAFGYWVLCALGRAKEDKNKYGLLTRKICAYSFKLWNLLRNQAKKIAQRIKNFQKHNGVRLNQVYSASVYLNAEFFDLLLIWDSLYSGSDFSFFEL